MRTSSTERQRRPKASSSHDGRMARAAPRARCRTSLLDSGGTLGGAGAPVMESTWEWKQRNRCTRSREKSKSRTDLTAVISVSVAVTPFRRWAGTWATARGLCVCGTERTGGHGPKLLPAPAGDRASTLCTGAGLRQFPAVQGQARERSPGLGPVGVCLHRADGARPGP